MNALILALLAAAPQQDTAYFQQRVAYRIEAVLDESAQVLHGRARVRYENRSTQTLDTLWFHLHLNAFRPNSAWARRELQFGERRFQDLGPNDHAFERLTRVEIDGAAVTPVFPGSPDSTVVAFPLRAPLAPGGSVTVDIDWDARPSTLPRRQGRQGRHYDFAQWYPRVAVFDRGGWQVQPLLPQGEFYGEFASWDVTLDVASDQVMAATGVPVDGDPGWNGARAAGTPEPWAKSDAYDAQSAESLGLLDNAAEQGRKRVRWRAEDVHHFAWTTDPAYIYEGGRFEDIAIHVLYRPGDDDWYQGAAVERTVNALAFFDSIFGAYPWPQLSNVHRLEQGGTEFPMLIMDGSANEGLIVHETAHQYVHGILANNEWREGWLDEGFASFVSGLYEEAKGNRPDRSRMIEGIAGMERAGLTQPIGLPSAEFRDYQTYGAMTYNKTSLVLEMLRFQLGDDVFRRGLKHYYEQNRLRHVRESDFRAAMEAASGEDLGWFFQQWIHTTNTLDYAIGEVRLEQSAEGWVTHVEVTRTGEAWMPVVVQVGETRALADAHDRRQVVSVTTRTRPDRVVLDPDHRLLDLDQANDTKTVPAGSR